MTAKDEAIEVFRNHTGMLRTGEALSLGIHPRTLYQLRNEGLIEQVARGLFQLVEAASPGEPDLVLVAKKIPQAVICLISALAYHQITTQIPHFVYVAIPSKCNQPRLDYPPIRYFRYLSKYHQSGIEIVSIDGHKVKIYNIEKTLADCVKFRHKIGQDVVIEALKLYWQRPSPRLDLLYHYAKENRVVKILQPILETIVS